MRRRMVPGDDRRTQTSRATYRSWSASAETRGESPPAQPSSCSHLTKARRSDAPRLASHAALSVSSPDEETTSAPSSKAAHPWLAASRTEPRSVESGFGPNYGNGSPPLLSVKHND